MGNPLTNQRNLMLAPDEPKVACQERFATINLPRELRDRVYRELLVPGKVRNPREHIPTYDLEPAILRVNKQIHAEAAEILYRENTWILLEIRSGSLFQELRTPICGRTVMASIKSFPDLPALKVDIHGPTIDNVDRKILVARCDLHRFFASVIIRALKVLSQNGWQSLEFDLQFYGRNRKEEEFLVDFFQDVRGARKVSVRGTSDLSTGRELAILMMTPIAHIDELYERINIYRARGDRDFAYLKYQKAMETYEHGFTHLASLKYLHSESWPEGKLEGATLSNVQILEFKDGSLNFAWAVCSLKLRNDVRDDVNDAYGPGPDFYEESEIEDDSFEEATGTGDMKDDLEVFLKHLREEPADQRVDEEIDYMEAQLRSIFPKE